MWVIYCQYTNQYLLDSDGKDIDPSDIRNAKIYKTLAGAKSSCKKERDCSDLWDRQHRELCERGWQDYIDQGIDFHKRDWIIVKVGVTVWFLEEVDY